MFRMPIVYYVAFIAIKNLIFYLFYYCCSFNTLFSIFVEVNGIVYADIG